MKNGARSAAGIVVAVVLITSNATASEPTPNLGPVTYRKVILEGEQAPDFPDGMTIQSLGNLIAINDSGQTAFWAAIEEPGSIFPTYVLYSEHGNVLHLEHVRSASIPEVDAAHPEVFVHDAPHFSSTGRLFGLVSFLTADGSNPVGLVRWRDGAGSLLALEGEPIVGLSMNGVVKVLTTNLEGAGDVVANRIVLQHEGEESTHVVRFDNEGAQSLLMTGAPAPHLTGATIETLSLAGLSFSGSAGIVASIQGESAQSPIMAAYEVDGSPQLSVQDGDPIVDHPDGSFRYFLWNGFPNVNARYDGGTFVGAAATTVDQSTIEETLGFVHTTDSGVRLIALGGDVVSETPGAQLLLNPVWDRPWSVGQNVMAGIVRASIDLNVWDEDIAYLIYDRRSAALDVPLATGVPAPFATDQNPIFLPSEPCVNNQDRVLLSARHQHTNGKSDSFDLLYVRTEDGVLSLRIEKGDEIEVEPGDVRTIAFMSPYPSYMPTVRGETCFAVSFNSHGQTALAIEFTDGTRGVFVADVAVSAPTPDLDSNAVVDGADLAALLSAWGPCATPFARCAADFNSDGSIDGADLGTLLTNWGMLN